MPSRKGLEQALTWLKSKIAEKDTLDAINAEVCYNVICDLQERRRVIGALYHQTNTAKKKAQEELDEMKYEKYYEDRVKQLHGYSKIDVTLNETERSGDRA